MPAETSQTLDRGVRVLQLLAHAPDGLTVTELAQRLHTSRAVVYRLLATLVEHALVRRDDDGRHFVGMGVLGLAAGVRPQLREAAAPVLRTLAEAVGATACLTIADGYEALVVAAVEPTWTEFHVSYRVGTRHPLDRSASGRAIQLGDSGSLDDSGSLGESGPQGHSGPAYVASSGELEVGAHGIAAPIRGVEGFRASVGIVALGKPLVEDAVVPHVLAAAADLAARLS